MKTVTALPPPRALTGFLDSGPRPESRQRVRLGRHNSPIQWRIGSANGIGQQQYTLSLSRTCQSVSIPAGLS